MGPGTSSNSWRSGRLNSAPARSTLHDNPWEAAEQPCSTFVAVLGLTATATGQIGAHFDALKETTVTIDDVGDGEQHDDPQPVDFPANADSTRGSSASIASTSTTPQRW